MINNNICFIYFQLQLCPNDNFTIYFTIIVKQSSTPFEYPSFEKFNEIT